MASIALYKHVKGRGKPSDAFRRREPAVTYVGEIELPDNGSLKIYGRNLENLARNVALNIMKKRGSYDLFSDPDKTSPHPSKGGDAESLNEGDVLRFEEALRRELGRMKT